MKNLIPKIGVPIGVVGILLLLIMPIPSVLLDILIGFNIIFALVILLTTMFVRKPLDFSVFPSLLLVATLFRLGLNVASTRLVLGEGFAGQVIQAFGHVAVGGSVIIGTVIFLILVVIQFVVVTKGAERVAEVGARFTLDAMPGKQMAIDADLNAGLIDDAEARRRRAEVSAEADFYGAMDGASKFVKGDAIAGIIIIVINVIGGIAMGMLMKGMEIGEAVEHYTILTIGDGLVTQIPALLMAVSTGMIVTRSNAESDLGSTTSKQLSQSRLALSIAGVAAIAMGMIPGMPFLAFAAIGFTLVFIGQRIKSNEKKAEQDAKVQSALVPQKTETADDIIDQMRVAGLEIALSPDLVDIVSGASDDLLARVRSLRKNIALEMGFMIPPVRTRDSVDLPVGTYSISIAGAEAARGQAPSGMVLAIGSGPGLDALPGETTIEPVFGLPGKWVPSEMRRNAEMAGATVIDRVSVVVTHLNAVVLSNAPRLLTREDVRILTDHVKRSNPSAVEELTPNPLSLAEVQRVLQGLLTERVAINDLPRIYEGVGLRAKTTSDPEQLIEAARASLGPALVQPYLEDGTLNVITFAPTLEQQLLEGLRPSEGGTVPYVGADVTESIISSIQTVFSAVNDDGAETVVVCSPQLRPAVRRLIAAHKEGVPVLSYIEATAVPNTNINTVGVIRHEPAHV
ncbi:flagellar biosynthesis protein FlhA [Leifsonia sp. Leaf264]|uniref:flagellar biosynthesis protein FlhA n=1 Tax=Leifsonia sp. Leaf264 TaxID=1736314 RepID=UPI0006F4F102|nr:flagellar biosynthesis protein FlhA [Leifsonia sp. Leaf264]KQO98250.1 flagellar biosynthesis protein FlhA [Leifsonia sp. Leaf264]